MPLEPRPGVVIQIPCRHCGRCMIRFTVEEGAHVLNCTKCGSGTQVRVELEGGAWQIRTAPASGRSKSGR